MPYKSKHNEHILENGHIGKSDSQGKRVGKGPKLFPCFKMYFLKRFLFGNDMNSQRILFFNVKIKLSLFYIFS